MNNQQLLTKAELLTEIEQAWTTLNSRLDQLTEDQMTKFTDAEGWAVKDHITHLAMWERSITFFLQGKSRSDGLGVDEDLYLNGGYDAINAVIQQQHRDLSSAAAREQLREMHQQLLALLRPLTDADLQKPYRHYLPDEPGEGGGRSAMNLIYANTANHFREHLGWIETLLAQ